MLKKKPVIITICIILFLGFYLILNALVFFYLAKSDLKNILLNKSAIPYKPNSDDNIPSEIKKFSNFEEIKNLKYIYNTTLEFYNNKDSEKNINIEKEYKPSNYNEYSTEFCEHVFNRIKQDKNKVFPTVEEYQNKPGGPNFKTVRNTVRLWAHVSVLLDVEGKDKESLLVPYLAYYYSRDLETQYLYGGTFLAKLISCAMNSLADTAITRWASKPRPHTEKLSKCLADDLLQLIDIEIPAGNCINYEKYYAKAIFSTAKHPILKFCNLGGYAERRTDYFYDKASKLSSLPWCDSMADWDKFKSECNECFFLNLYNSDNQAVAVSNALLKFCFSPRKFYVDLILQNIWPHEIRTFVVGNVEVKLAKMEMTAIALLYNSFYSENNRVPETMEELEKWYGKELPKNRLNGKPYKFYEKEGYVLYNGLEGTTESKYSKPSPFFFIFNEK